MVKIFYSLNTKQITNTMVNLCVANSAIVLQILFIVHIKTDSDNKEKNFYNLSSAVLGKKGEW